MGTSLKTPNPAMCAYCNEDTATIRGRYRGYCSPACKTNHERFTEKPGTPQKSQVMNDKTALAESKAFRALPGGGGDLPPSVFDPSRIQHQATVTCLHCSSKINHDSLATICGRCGRSL